MRLSPIRSLTPLLLAIASLPLSAAEGDGGAAPAPQPAPAAGGENGGGDNGADKGTGMPAKVLAEARYRAALAQYRQAHFAEAKDLVEAALRADPSHEGAIRLRSDVDAVLGSRSDTLQMAANWFKSIQDVRTQELAVRLDGLITTGDQKMAQGDYAGAELDYDRVEVGLRTFPYSFDWGNLPAEVASKRLEARSRSRQAEEEHERDSRRQAEIKAQRERDLQEEALRDKVDEPLHRARVAYDRKDYKRSEVLAWNAYDLDRRREDARSLYLAARREGHIDFDDNFRKERLERLALVNEEIHKSLIPQAEILVYPEDWARRSLRQPQQIGDQKEEPWVQALRDHLDQVIYVNFQEATFDDVVAYMRQVTAVNIVVAPDVTGTGTIPPVTFSAKAMKFGDALKWIMSLTGLHYALKDQAIFISTKPVLGALELRLYDVTDLISPVKDFPGRELAFNAGGGGKNGPNLFGGGAAGGNGGGEGQGKVTSAEDLVEFIKNNVAKDSWSGEGIGMEPRNGQTLFVTQTPEVHQQLQVLLANLRNQQALQCNVHVRMLDITKNFYEELGFSYVDPTIPFSFDLLSSSSAVGSQPPIPPQGNGPGEGYMRENGNLSFAGSLDNSQLPANQTEAAYNAYGGTVPRGLYVESSHSIFNFLNADQLNMVFQASEEETDSQVNQEPSITCFNGQRANASFMTEYAYIQSYDVVASTLEPQIAVLNFGNIIDVRPVISSDHKYITMEIRPTSVELQGVFTEILFAPRIITTGNATFFDGEVPYPIELPNVLVRTMRSSVMIPDKASLLIGGFNKSLRQRTQTGVPFLSNIPFLGRLFTRNGTYDENAKLFIMLSAEVVDLKEKEAEQ